MNLEKKNSYKKFLLNNPFQHILNLDVFFIVKTFSKKIQICYKF
jgi:hypothetical protein